MYVCLSIYMYVMSVCVCVCMHVRTYVCLYVCMYVCNYVCMYVCISSVYIYIYIYDSSLQQRQVSPSLETHHSMYSILDVVRINYYYLFNLLGISTNQFVY